MLPFETLAIEYVQEQTDVIQKFGTDMEIECVHRVLTLYDGYDKHIFYDDYEKVVEILEIHLMVNDKDTCIVVFESNDEKRLVIDHYYWK